MQDFLQHLKSTDFWIFGVVLAILLSVLGNYATRFLDRVFQLGTRSIRALSTRGKEKRQAKLNHINDWIDSHENGAVLVLSEAHFLCFLGLTMAILIVSLLLLGRVELGLASSPIRILLATVTLTASVLAIAAMNVGGTLLDAIRKHPKGLIGLHLDQAKRNN
jgi:hypothetical protein